MSGAHALLAPSSATRWEACAGSVMLSAMYPDEETEETLAGDASHWGGFQLLDGHIIAAGQVAPNGVVLTDEMIEGAELYVAAVDARLQACGLPRVALHTEERISIPSIHSQNWGTPDAWFYAPRMATLDVFDYKYGHRFVDEFENWQLIDYTCGILDQLGIDGLGDQTLIVNLHIVQPRCYQAAGQVRTWSIRASALRPYFNKLRNAAEAAMLPNATCTPNPECLDCKARHACKALQRDGYRSAQISTDSIPVEMPGDALGLELHFLRNAAVRLKGRITGLEQQVESRLRAGERIPYSAMVSVQSREKWSKPITEVLALGELFAIDISKNDAITPKQAIAAGIPADVVRMYSAQSSGMKLEADDGREARKVFGNSY